MMYIFISSLLIIILQATLFELMMSLLAEPKSLTMDLHHHVTKVANTIPMLQHPLYTSGSDLGLLSLSESIYGK